MSKAIETIKKHIKDLERMEDVFFFYDCFSSASECKKAIKELSEAIAEFEAQEAKSCEWVQHDTEYDTSWHGSCGIGWMLEEGTPHYNAMNFCPKCGGKLIEKATK